MDRKESCLLSKLSSQGVMNSKIRYRLCRQTPTAVQLKEEGNAINYKPDSSKQILVTVPMSGSYMLLISLS